MRVAIANGCLVLLTFALTSSAAFATQATVSVSGGGTLTYTYTTQQGSCETTHGRGTLIYYDITYYTGFSYTSTSGGVTPLSGTVKTVALSGCGPSSVTPDPLILSSSPASLSVSFVAVPGSEPPTGTATLGVAGFINPKYKIMGVVYTVPGEQSYVQYTDTTMMGTSTSTSSSFSTGVTSSLEVCGGAGVGGNGTSICGTYSNSFTQESDTSSSFATSQSTSFINQWYPLDGPALDHGNDVIYVWVNPQAWYTMYPTSSTGTTPLFWNGYTYDETDDSNNMEVIPLRLSWCQNPSLIPTGVQGRLLRAWAPNNTDGTGPAITDQDLLNITAADPFSNPKYAVTIGSDGKTTTDGRFTQTTNGELFYLQGNNETYNWSYSTTDTEGQGGKNTYVQSFAIEVKNSASWIAHISFDWKESTSFTWTDQWNELMTQMMSQMNSVSIHGWTPPYSGPDEFNIYQDNVYGTFMVNPVPPT